MRLLEPGTKLLLDVKTGYGDDEVTTKTVYFLAILGSGELLVNDAFGQFSDVWAKNCRFDMNPEPRKPRASYGHVR